MPERPIKRKATIVEVAARAKVAFSTVSRVLNGGYASEDARKRVQKAARELGYSPSPAARNLKMGRQGCVGLVVESSQDPWFTQVLAGIEEGLEEKTVGLMLGSLALRGRYDDGAVRRWLTERRVDGVIFARCTRREEELVKLARRERVPCVFVAPDEHFSAGPIISTRNRESAAELTEHLLALGHRRLGFLGGPRESLDTRHRLEGMRDALATRALQLAAAEVEYAASYGSDGGASAAARWLARRRASAPTAMVCANDTLALGFLRALLAAGVRVPSDISVTGFDNSPEAALYWPGLTTIRQPSREMGVSACQALFRLIANPEVKDTARLELPATLVIRESTAAAGGARESGKMTAARR